jgi:hypothetical protein
MRRESKGESHGRVMYLNFTQKAYRAPSSTLLTSQESVLYCFDRLFTILGKNSPEMDDKFSFDICNMELDKQKKTVNLRLIVDVDPGHSTRRSNPPSR